ncbi:MAG: DUF3035 domain-containing protein [Amaricoccus sp.]|uniref:DUF3035 domain-containing protein n=1 Tax=Amaricoccus sp. TaxID=1872485 RepID=UPI0039E55898
MRSRRTLAAATLLLAVTAVAGCQGRGAAGALRSAGVGSTPDEFMVLPTKPLDMPKDLAALPPPTPGAVNRVDYQPLQQAVAGLTGRPTLATTNGTVLVARAGPVDPNVRTELASEDAEWRATHHGLFFERMFTRDKASLVYKPMVLDAPAELERLRRMGIEVPPPPPAVMDQN